MSNELIAEIAAAGARVIVASMATDAWNAVRDRVVSILGHGHDKEEAEEDYPQHDKIEEMNRAITLSSEEERASVTASHHERIHLLLTRVMMNDPNAIEKIRALAMELGSRTDVQTASGSQIAYAEGDAQQAVQYTGTQTNTFQRDRER